MAEPLAQKFRADLAEIYRELLSVPAMSADVPWRRGGWTRKQIVGHLLDSAGNNRQRFVRASIDGVYAGPGYAQDAWVQAHGYADQPWTTLLEWWKTEHDMLAAVVDRIPEERLDALCTIADGEPVTLRTVIEDYVRHQRWHLSQLQAGVIQG